MDGALDNKDKNCIRICTAFPKTPTSETKCYTHGRIRREYIKYFDYNVDTGINGPISTWKKAEKIRNYFTSVQMTINQDFSASFLKCKSGHRLKAAKDR